MLKYGPHQEYVAQYIIAYNSPATDPEVATQTNDPSVCEFPKVGDTVEVVYMADDPTLVDTTDDPYLPDIQAVSFQVFALLTGVVIFLLYGAWRNLKNKPAGNPTREQKEYTSRGKHLRDTASILNYAGFTYTILWVTVPYSIPNRSFWVIPTALTIAALLKWVSHRQPFREGYTAPYSPTILNADLPSSTSKERNPDVSSAVVSPRWGRRNTVVGVACLILAGAVWYVGAFYLVSGLMPVGPVVHVDALVVKESEARIVNDNMLDNGTGELHYCSGDGGFKSPFQRRDAEINHNERACRPGDYARSKCDATLLYGRGKEYTITRNYGPYESSADRYKSEYDTETNYFCPQPGDTKEVSYLPNNPEVADIIYSGYLPDVRTVSYQVFAILGLTFLFLLLRGAWRNLEAAPERNLAQGSHYYTPAGKKLRNISSLLGYSVLTYAALWLTAPYNLPGWLFLIIPGVFIVAVLLKIISMTPLSRKDTHG